MSEQPKEFDELHRWEIEPHPDTDYDTLVTDSDNEARQHILDIAERHLWDDIEAGQERVMKVRMNDVATTDAKVVEMLKLRQQLDPDAPDTIVVPTASHENAREWRSIETAPKNGTYILLLGDSGYTTTPHRIAVGCWIEGYREYWLTHSNDAFTDDGAEPTHWLPLPDPPKERA